MTLTRQGIRRLDDPKELRQRRQKMPAGGVCLCRCCDGTGTVVRWIGEPEECRYCLGYGQVERMTGRPWRSLDLALPPIPKFGHLD